MLRDAQGNVLAIYQKKDNNFTWKEQHLYGSSRLGIFAPEVKIQGVYVLDVAALKQSVRTYELTNHLGNVLSTITDKGVITSAQDYFPFGLTLASRSFTEGGSVYRFGFNGKEDDKCLKQQDYGFRLYRPDLGKFLTVDPLTKKFPELTPYQFASNAPIWAIDLDGLEASPTNSGAYEGQKQTTTEHRVVNDRYGHTAKKDWVWTNGGTQANGEQLKSGWIESEKYGQFIKEVGKVLGGQDGAKAKTNPFVQHTNENDKQIDQYIPNIAENPNFEKEWGRDFNEGYSKGYQSAINQGSGRIDPVDDPFTFMLGGALRGMLTRAATEAFTVNVTKFDYFFGRVVTGSQHNVTRSAQNLKDLTTLGVTTEGQLMRVFNDAMKRGAIISTKTNEYGTTVTKAASMGSKGQIDVSFFYREGNMNTIPSITTIIPKIFK